MTVAHDKSGIKLLVEGKEFMIKGMNWDYYPIGTNYTYNLWEQPEPLIKSVLEEEMGMMKKMGVNVVRLSTAAPPEWVEYIYKHYRIYTMLNHTLGRYGVSIDGEWVAKTDYSDSETRNILLEEVRQMAIRYHATPGLLIYLLGNENNYGLSWEGSATEDIPDSLELASALAEPLYTLFNEASLAVKSIDSNHPVAICNGDLQYFELIKSLCKNADILGTNMYRGYSFYSPTNHRDPFEKVSHELNMPILFTELGADAFHAVEQVEDQTTQARYLVHNWKEIYENVAGLSNAGNAIGGFTFQFSDGWWKYDQTRNLEVHDQTASWSNGGYVEDYVQGENNMNEEWFGLCAKERTNDSGHYTLIPRKAFYAVKSVYAYDPYVNGLSPEMIDHYFSGILNSLEEDKATQE